jgi:hypothetical protein
MMSHNGMIDGDEKRLDSGVTDLSSTFRNFVRNWEASCLESLIIHPFVGYSLRYREDPAEMISNYLLVQSMVAQFVGVVTPWWLPPGQAR